MRQYIFINIVSILLLYISSFTSPASATPCLLTTTQIAIGKPTPFSGSQNGDVEEFLLEVPRRGLLFLEALAPAQSSAAPWITIRPSDCGTALGVPRTLLRSLSRRVLSLEPGSYILEAGFVHVGTAELPGEIITGFLPLEDWRESKLSMLPSRDSNEDSNSDDEEGSDDGDTEESVNQILPSIQAPGGSGFYERVLPKAELLRLAWCRENVEASHRVFFCSTDLALGDTEVGRLEDDLNGSHRTYSFHLDRSQNIRVFTSGTTDTVGTLLDEAGFTLVRDDDSGVEANFTIEAFLPPGRYDLRIQKASGAGGAYQVTLE